MCLAHIGTGSASRTEGVASSGVRATLHVQRLPDLVWAQHCTVFERSRGTGFCGTMIGAGIARTKQNPCGCGGDVCHNQTKETSHLS
jgi:hypothetical protein